MKKPFLYSIFFVLIALLLTSCKKQDSCDATGGVSLGRGYYFWTSVQDTPIVVNVFDADGNQIFKNFGQVATIYTYYGANANLNCSMMSSANAYYDLPTKEKEYTYTATGKTRTWNGSIKTPCEDGGCDLVELKP